MGLTRVAALYDIHGNLPALEAVLADVRTERVDAVVVGGDVVPGPMPGETLRALTNLDLPVHYIHGNGELAILAQMEANDPAEVTFWGSASGAAPAEPVRESLRWTAGEIQADYQRILASWPRTTRLNVEGLGPVLFCHSTPRSAIEIFTRSTAEDRLAPVFAGIAERTVVCGHTHMQFDRWVGRTRVVNAGSVGMPFGEPGAHWLLLGPGFEFRHTSYDLADAADRVRTTRYPQAMEFAEQNVLRAPSEVVMLAALGRAEL
jgi:predicted phosphodiesterase